MTSPGATALLLVAALSAAGGRPERVLVVAPRSAANPMLGELTRAVGNQLARGGRRTVIPDSALRKALEESGSEPVTDYDDPAQIARALQAVDADYLVSVVSPRTLIVRSSDPGRPTGRLVATAGGEPADIAMDLVRQLDRPLASPAIAPPPPLPPAGERVQLEVRVAGGTELAGSADGGEYAVSVGFEAPFASRWSVAGAVGLELGPARIDLCTPGPLGCTAPLGSLLSSFRLPVALDLRWAFLKGGSWITQALVGAEASYVGLERSDSFGLTLGPSLGLQLGYLLSQRLQVRVGARYVAAFFISDPAPGTSPAGEGCPDCPFQPELVPLAPLRHQLHGFVAVDLVL